MSVTQKGPVFSSSGSEAEARRLQCRRRLISRHRNVVLYFPLLFARLLPLRVSQGKGLAAALHSHLPARLLQLPRSWGSLLIPFGTGRPTLPSGAGRPTLPSLRTLGSVRSMGDLKRELAAAGGVTRAATAEPAGQKRDTVGAGTGDLAIKKSAGKEELEEGKAARQAGAAPTVAVAAGAGAGAAEAAGSTAAEVRASVAAKAPTGPGHSEGSSETGRPAEAAAASAANGSSSANDGKLTSAADAGIDGVLPTSTTSGEDQHESPLSRKRRSAGSQAAEDGELSPSSSGVNGSTALMAAGSRAGPEASAGTSTAAATNVR